METYVFEHPENLATKNYERFEFKVKNADQIDFIENLHEMLYWLGVSYNTVHFEDDKVVVVAERKVMD